MVDAAALGSGAARGNAGFLCPTLLAPLPGPGMLRNAARALVDRDGSLRIRPGAVPSMARWGMRFVRASTTRRFEAGRAALAALVRGQPELLARLAASGVDVAAGEEIVVPFHDARLAERFHAELEPMGALGVPGPGPLLDGAEVRRLVPALTDHVNAGFALPGNRAADPRRFVDSLDRRAPIAGCPAARASDHHRLRRGGRSCPAAAHGRWRRGRRRAGVGRGRRAPRPRTSPRPATGGGGWAGLQRRSPDHRRCSAHR